jgi:hypothetical protein
MMQFDVKECSITPYSVDLKTNFKIQDQISSINFLGTYLGK